MPRYYDAPDYVPITGSRRGAVNLAYHAVRRVTVVRRERLVRTHVRRPPGRVLDVGCGTGEFLARMRRLGWDAVGVDASPRAAARAVEIGGGVVHRVDDLRTLGDERFDAITLWHALEHLHGVNEQLAAVRRLLAADGVLVVAAPNHHSPDAEHYGAGWYAWDVPRHLWHFTAGTMRDMLAKHGFRVTAMRTMPFDPVYVSLLSERHAGGRTRVTRALRLGVRSMLAGMRDVTRSSAITYVARPA
jgi:SAM-dependent methyltransferase